MDGKCQGEAEGGGRMVCDGAESRTRQGRAGQAVQDKAMQGRKSIRLRRAWQGRTGQDRTGQGRAGNGTAGKGSAHQGKAGQEEAG